MQEETTVVNARKLLAILDVYNEQVMKSHVHITYALTWDAELFKQMRKNIKRIFPGIRISINIKRHDANNDKNIYLNICKCVCFYDIYISLEIKNQNQK